MKRNKVLRHFKCESFEKLVKIIRLVSKGGRHMLEFGGLFGWLIVIAFLGTILNYGIKFINKRISRKLTNPTGKKIMRTLMILFVRNHRYFGFATGVFLLLHVIVQFTKFGLNATGGFAAILMIIQVSLGIYSIVKKKPRKGAWFITHRVIAILLVLGIGLHIFFPYAIQLSQGKENTPKVAKEIEDTELPTFTLEELSEYNGENGNKAYVAYQGYVYDVTEVPAWREGQHNGHVAGMDITEAIGIAPHGERIFENLEIVGKLAQ